MFITEPLSRMEAGTHPSEDVAVLGDWEQWSRLVETVSPSRPSGDEEAKEEPAEGKYATYEYGRPLMAGVLLVSEFTNANYIASTEA